MGVCALQMADLFPEIIGHSPEIRTVLDLVRRVASSDSGVLIQGESGTGKELIATAIHRLSARAGKRLLALNCSAIPENLLESELFGHEKGAFTGADRKRKGYFELASGGTIFLDEIGDMTLHLQSKLLRVLQEKKYIPLGGTETKTADARVIAATNTDLEQAIRQDRSFRLDLYYRLNVLPIRIPPLQERKTDIKDLLLHFLGVYNKTYAQHEPCYFAPETIALLTEYKWPGNVRQLQNLVERLVVTTAGGELLVKHLPPEFQPAKKSNLSGDVDKSLDMVATGDDIDQVVRAGARAFGEPGFKLNEHVKQLENQFIIKALRTTGNNRNRAAKILGLNRTTLVERIKKRRLQMG